jgi:hypothetical protein
MPKPDKVMRLRPLKELAPALEKLTRVALFHPQPIVVEEVPTYCVCKKGEARGKKYSNEMIQCDQCCEWFHFDCVGIARGTALGDDEWKCEWCLDTVDKEGYQRWRTGRKKPKKRHHRDEPRHHGVAMGLDKRPKSLNPPDWDGKVKQVREEARRAAVKKRKLTDAVELLVDKGGHHVVDAEGMAGLETRPVDDALVDELVGAGLVTVSESSDSE